jgi:hypothetical protein
VQALTAGGDDRTPWWLAANSMVVSSELMVVSSELMVVSSELAFSIFGYPYCIFF